jgi:hypothetical protein
LSSPFHVISPTPFHWNKLRIRAARLGIRKNKPNRKKNGDTKIYGAHPYLEKRAFGLWRMDLATVVLATELPPKIILYEDFYSLKDFKGCE